MKDVHGGIEIVRQAMYHVADDYVLSPTRRMVTTDVLRGVAIAPVRTPSGGAIRS